MIRRPPRSTLFPYTTLFRSTSGSIVFEGRDLADLSGRERAWFRTRVQAVFQDATASLNPRMRIRALIAEPAEVDRKSTRLNSSHANISYAVFCLKKKKMITS